MTISDPHAPSNFTLLELVPLPILLLDAAGETRAANRRAREVFGPEIPQALAGVVEADRQAGPRGPVAEALASGTALRDLLVCLRPPHSAPVEAFLTLEPAEDGCFLLTLQPLDPGRPPAARQRHQALFETTPDGIMVVDDDGRYVEVNASMARMVGTTPEDMTGRHFSEFIPPELLERAVQAFGELQRDRCLAMEFPMRSLTGEIVWCEWRSCGNFVPGLHFCVARDITRRRAAQEALRESQERLSAVVNHSPAAIVLKDAAGRYVLLNEQAQRLAGRPVEEVLGRTDHELFPPEVAERFQASDARVLRSGQPLTYEESFSLEGRQRSFITTKFPLRGPDGAPVALGAVSTDITSRREMEEALRESEARYRLASEAGRVGVWDWQVGSERFYIGPELRALLGYSAEELPDSFDAWCGLVHPADRDRVAAATREHLEGRTPVYEVEVRRRQRGGGYRWFLARGTAQRNEAGEAIRLTGSDTDIHHRKTAEETLEHEHNLRKAIEDAMADGVAAIDAEGRQTYVNPAFCRMVGFSAEELLGLSPPYPYWPPDELPAIRAAFDATLRGEIPDGGFELRLGRKDGSRFDAVVKPAPLRDERGQPAGWVVCIQDVTDRKRAADNLYYVMDRAHCLLWHANVTECASTRTGLRWSFDFFDEDAAQRFLPLQLEEGEPYMFGYYRHKPEEDRRAVDRNAVRAFREGRSGYQQEFRIRRADGDQRWLYEEVRIEPTGPGAWRAAGLVTDVTDRKRLEQELRRQMAALGEAGRRKDEFLAMLAHELRNPLGAISNAVHVLAQPDASEETRRHAIEVMRRQLHHQTRMVADLLDASRLTRGLVELQPEPVELNALVRAGAEDCRGALERGGRELAVELPEVPLWVHGDPIRLAQVLGNLLHNAEKFTGAGDRVTVRLEPRPNAKALLTVSDTGHGIDAGVLPHVFDSFVQGDRTLARSTGGLGLGLALVRGLVELHHGSVRAESDGLGRGARFLVELPLTAAPERAASPERTPVRFNGEIRVLIIEDNPDAAETLQEVLELAGCRARVALDGHAGLRAAGEFRPNVILCDIGLPGMDGYEVATRIRALNLPLRRLIALTGYGGEADRRRSREAGFDEHLTKPVDFQRLEELIAAAG